jgi:hypothetical protein
MKRGSVESPQEEKVPVARGVGRALHLKEEELRAAEETVALLQAELVKREGELRAKEESRSLFEGEVVGLLKVIEGLQASQVQADGAMVKGMSADKSTVIMTSMETHGAIVQGILEALDDLAARCLDTTTLPHLVARLGTKRACLRQAIMDQPKMRKTISEAIQKATMMAHTTAEARMRWVIIKLRAIIGTSKAKRLRQQVSFEWDVQEMKWERKELDMGGGLVVSQAIQIGSRDDVKIGRMLLCERYASRLPTFEAWGDEGRYELKGGKADLRSLLTAAIQALLECPPLARHLHWFLAKDADGSLQPQVGRFVFFITMDGFPRYGKQACTQLLLQVANTGSAQHDMDMTVLLAIMDSPRDIYGIAKGWASRA